MNSRTDFILIGNYCAARKEVDGTFWWYVYRSNTSFDKAPLARFPDGDDGYLDANLFACTKHAQDAMRGQLSRKLDAEEKP